MNLVPIRFAVPAIVGLTALVSTTGVVVGQSITDPRAEAAARPAAPAAPADPEPSPGPSPSPSPEPVPPPVVAPPAVPPGPDLVRGSQGPDVALLQMRLEALGYQTRTVTSRYDSETAHAVTAFQKFHGLPRTGVVDAATRQALDNPLPALPVGTDDALHMEVDLTRQLVMVVESGVVTAIYDASTGRAGWETRTGEFTILWRINGWRRSRLGPMWRPAYFTKDGVAFHGGEPVPNRPASHGCVRLTDPSINELFPRLDVGTPVVVY